MPGIIARTYTIISEYMRYKYNPNSPSKRGRALKICLIHAIKEALQVAKANIIKYMELH